MHAPHVNRSHKKAQKVLATKRHKKRKGNSLKNFLCFLCLFVAKTLCLFVAKTLCLFVALFVPQRFDRIERGGFAGGVVAEEDSYRRGE